MSRKAIIFIWLFTLSPFIIVFTLVSLASYEFFGPLPSFEQLENPDNNLATEIISVDSVVLGKYFFENRTSASKEEIVP
jgi:penicillin-binding protein 1A